MLERKFKTRQVNVAGLKIGAENPIRVQSMTDTSTKDVAATVEQILRLHDVGCEMARVTVQGMKEAWACEEIKNRLVQKNCLMPLVADIHFYPPAALAAADFVDKIRINPGNFADKRAQFEKVVLDEVAYQAEIEKIKERFVPLLEKCKKRSLALRIGSNHGSLSDRIMTRYGNTAEGMVQAAFEFANICREMDFHNFLFSMKSSNPLVMIEAYRLLVERQLERGWNYPLHLGVTEAGFGQAGRVKSAVGLSSLLLDGIGDTIRVSITEDPCKEIKVCKDLLEIVSKERQKIDAKNVQSPVKERRSQGQLWLSSSSKKLKKADLEHVDGVLLEDSEKVQFPKILQESLQSDEICYIKGACPDNISLDTKILFYQADNLHSLRKLRKILGNDKKGLIAVFEQREESLDFALEASVALGPALCEGLADGIVLRSSHTVEAQKELAIDLLQASRLKNLKIEFISCPSCGRTLFDLEQVTQKIQKRTKHLAGLKIAVMGCIVNGPGEMADADFGYVGSKAGMIDLYVAKDCVEKNIPFDEAEERLVTLIKAHGKWKEAP